MTFAPALPGDIAAVEIQPGRNLVDTGPIVAFDEGMGYEVGKAGNWWKTTMLGGEGLVCRITDPWRFCFQTRSPGGRISWIIPQIPPRSK